MRATYGQIYKLRSETELVSKDWGSTFLGYMSGLILYFFEHSKQVDFLLGRNYSLQTSIIILHLATRLSHTWGHAISPKCEGWFICHMALQNEKWPLI